MKSDDAEKFDMILSRLFKTMGRSIPDPDVKRVWWNVFKNVSLQDFAEACAEYVSLETRGPVPAAVKKHLPRKIAAQRVMIYQRSSQRGREGYQSAVDLLRECRRKLEVQRGENA